METKGKVKTEGVVHIALYRPEKAVIDRLVEEGYPVSETLREWIRQKGREMFHDKPAYVQVKEKQVELQKLKLDKALEVERAKKEAEERIANMSNEEYATSVLRGKVVGNEVEFRAPNAMQIFLPLASIKDYTEENNEDVRNHNNLLRGEHRYINGRPPSESELARIFRDF